MNKMSAFEEKMAKFQSRKSNIATPTTPGIGGVQNAPNRAT
jgi:hypothetical protein